MGLHVTQEEYDRWMRAGLIRLDQAHPAPPPPKGRRLPKRKLVPSVFVPPATWLVGVECFAEANARGHWSKHHGRKAGQQRKVSELLGKHLATLAPFAEHYHTGKPILIKLTRLGGQRMDQWDNLPRALKAILDTVCLICGIDDGSPLLRVEFDQESNDRLGVRITLEKA